MVILKIIDHENNTEKEYDIHSYHKKESEIIIKQWNDNEEEIEIKIPISEKDNIEWIPERVVIVRGK